MTPWRWLALVVVVLALIFAMQGGEYSTWHWLTLRSEERELTARLAQLRETLDSLEAEAKAIETDPLVQERVAREEFGMLRTGEFAYRIVDEQP